MTILILAALLQDPAGEVAARSKDLESANVRTVYRAIERLADLGEAAVPALEKLRQTAPERTRPYLDLALDEIRAARELGAGYSKPKRVTLKSADRDVMGHLIDLKNQSGINVNLDDLAEEEDLPKVAVDLEEATPLEALDAVCKAGDLYLDFWRAGLFEVSTGGYEDAAKFFMRHFMMRLEGRSLVRTIEYGKPAVERLRVEATFVQDPTLLAALADRKAVILEARDDKGKNLIPPPAPEEKAEKPSAEPAKEETWLDFYDADAYLEEIELLAPSPGAEKIALLRGQVKLLLPKARKVVAIEKPAVGGTSETADFSLALRSLSRGEIRRSCVAKLELTSKTIKLDQLKKMRFVVDAYWPGAKKVGGYASFHEEGGHVEISVEWHDPSHRSSTGKNEPLPTFEKIEFTVVTETMERKVPFEFRDLKVK